MLIDAILIPGAATAVPAAVSSTSSPIMSPTFSATLASSIANSAPPRQDQPVMAAQPNAEVKPANVESTFNVRSVTTASANLFTQLVGSNQTLNPSLAVISKPV
ncbi:MAG: hypothetical protein WBX02_15495, partial [Terriglobales bacterium]